MSEGVIYVVLGGRLGNQLFQYAFARALKEKFYPGYHISINSYFFRNNTEQQKREGFEDSLRYFRLDDAAHVEKKLRHIKTFPQYCMTGIHESVLKKIIPARMLTGIDAKIFQPILNTFGIYDPESPSLYIEPKISRSKVIICHGFFEHAAYFDGIRNILLDEYTPRYDVLPHNVSLMNDITGCESVCVTIRRGDFLNIPSVNICGEKYFVDAMKAIRREVPGCKFFVFSDDVEDVKRNMHFPFDVVYESGNDPVWEKLRLMYSCRHFIISNSTFSWWAQYLSRNEHKIVYAPERWNMTDDRAGLYLTCMRKIECVRMI